MLLPVQAAQWNLPLFTSNPNSVLAAAEQVAHPEGADAVILSYSAEVRIASDGRMQKTVRTVTRVLRFQSVDHVRVLETRWNTTREEHPKLNARVITRDGQAHVLAASDIHERFVPTAVSDVNTETKLVSAKLNAADLDSVVETEIVTSDTKPGLAGRFGRISVPASFPIAALAISVTAPDGAPLRLAIRSLPGAKRTESSQAGMRQVTVQAANLIPPPPLALAPPEIAPQPVVEFSSAANWQTVAVAYATAVTKTLGSVAVSPGAQQARLDAIADALAWVHNELKFSGVRWGLGSYVPRSVDQIVKSGVGDPADEVVLLLSELAKRGIHASAALLTPAPVPDVSPELPGLEAFDSVVVYVPGPQPVWIDPSSYLMQIGRLPTADQGRWALIADASTTALTRAPEASASDDRLLDTTTIHLQDGGAASVMRQLETAGTSDEAFRPLLEHLARDEKPEAQKQLAKRFGFENVQSYDASDPKDLRRSSHLKIDGEGYAGSQVTDDGGHVNVPGPAALNLGRYGDLLRLATGTAEHPHLPPRQTDYYVGPPFTEELRYHVFAPSGFRFKQPEPAKQIDLGPMKLTSTVQLDPDGSLSVDYVLVSPKSRLTPNEGAIICNELVKVVWQNTLSVTLINIGLEQLAKGHLREGLSTLRQNAAGAPANSVPKLRLATAYIQVGARAEAEKICKDVISKEPENSAAYARLAWVYTHDEFGQLFEPGMNYPAAENSFRKALALDPGSKGVRLGLATLYLHSRAGVIGGAGARLPDAIQEYDRVGLAYLANSNEVNSYALALLCAKRFDALRKLFLYKEAEHADYAFDIAAISASDGVQGALQELDLSPAFNSKNATLTAAARYLLIAREYKSALDLLEAAGQKSTTAQSGIATLRRTSAWNGNSPGDPAPVLAMKRFVAAVVNPSDPEAWKRLVSPQWTEFDFNRSRRVLIALLEPDFAALMQLPGWQNVAADELTTSVPFSASGDEQSGFEIFFSGAAGRKGKLGTVVKRGSDYLVSSLEMHDRSSASTGLAPADVKSLAQRGKLGEAFILEQKRCTAAPSSITDCILDVRLGLLTGAQKKEMQETAEHTLELTHGENGDALENAALLAVGAGNLNQALLEGRKLAAGFGTHDQAATVFGRVAEALDLPLASASFYGEVMRPADDPELSSYALVQARAGENSGQR